MTRDPRGFLQHRRRLAPKRDVAERIRDHFEVTTAPDETLVREQAARCMDCGVPFCHAGCPLDNRIPEWNGLAAAGRWHDALRRLELTNDFPELTGRLCPAPCEAACVLAVNDQPVTIKQIEVAIADAGFANGWIRAEPPAHRSGRHVAVVGSGPAGLAAARALNRRGHRVTVFERDDLPGGLLRYGIPDYKLEKHHVDRRVALLEAEGVVFRCGADVGGDLSARDLRGAHDAVVVCTGSRVPRPLGVPGDDLDGVHHAMDYLVARNVAVRDGVEPSPISARGRHVVIVGGGDTGADCLGDAIREEAASIVQLEHKPRPPEARPRDNPWPEWPLVLHRAPVHDEGGERDWAVRTVALEGDASGRVRALVAERVVLHGDGEHRRFEPTGEAVRLRTDLVLLALGYTGPEPALLGELGVEVDGRGRIATGADQQTSVAGVFAAGDARRGQSLLVHAIAEGRRAAVGCDRWLRLHPSELRPHVA